MDKVIANSKIIFPELHAKLNTQLNESIKLLTIEANLDLQKDYSTYQNYHLDFNSIYIKNHNVLLNEAPVEQHDVEESNLIYNKTNLSYLGKRVVNLSKFKLGRAHTSVLEKGITFCPTPKGADLAEIHHDVSNFFRRLKLKLHFFDDENPNDDSFKTKIPPGLVKFRKKSNWCPKPHDNCLNAFIEKVNNDLSDLDIDISVDQNLTREERNALKELRDNDNIIIKKADKGSSIVVMNKDDYVKEAERQLSDTKFYKETHTDLTCSLNDRIILLLNALKDDESISVEIYNCLATGNPKTASLYLLPKIHKIKESNQFPPGRPIISANGCPTEKLSAFVDENIKGSIHKIPSYIRDTTDFIRRIESLRVPEDCILVTFDVTSLYTNIPNEEGIQAVKEFLKDHKPPYASANTVILLLTEVLTKNTFEFNGKNYLQVGGTAMGTKLAPSYANIFMGMLEQKTIQSYHKEPFLWVRFIDDIFVIWTHGEQELIKFHEHLNSFHESIKYTMEQSRSKIVFLDTWVKVIANRLIVELYTKPTDTHNYLHFTSSHPKHTKRAGPYGQFLRVRRNRTLQSDYIKHSKKMKIHYLNRGYPESLIESSRLRALSKDRSELLNPCPVKNKQNAKNENVVPLILTHHPSNYLVRKIINDNWNILKYSDLCQKALPESPLFTTRRASNIKDILVHSRLKPKGNDHSKRPNVKSEKCKRPFCGICKKLKNTNVVCTLTKKSHQLPLNIDCHTRNVVYVLTCEQCKKQYVGETKRNFYVRFKEHIAGIKHKRSYPVI